MANYWMHNGFLQVEGEKMSKSLGNFITIRELLAGLGRRPWSGEVIRLAMLGTHYRQPLDFNEPKLQYWRSKLSYWIDCHHLFCRNDIAYEMYRAPQKSRPSARIIESLSEDLNVHECFVYFDELAQKAVKQDSDAAKELGHNLIWLGLFRPDYLAAYEPHLHGSAKPHLLGKYQNEIDDARALVLNDYNMSRDVKEREKSLKLINEKICHLKSEMVADQVRLVVNEHASVSLDSESQKSARDTVVIDNLILARNEARRAKNFAESDRIRDELAKMGVVLKDNKDGTTTWEVAR